MLKIGVINLLNEGGRKMFQGKYDEKTFHTDLLDQYAIILDCISQLIPQDKQIDDIGIHLLLDENIPQQEKDRHLTILTHLSRINEQLQTHYRMSEHLKILHEFGNLISNTHSINEICKKAFHLVGRVMDVDAFFIALYEPERNVIHFPLLVDLGEFLEPFSIPFGEGIVSKVIKTREILHLKTSMELDKHGAKTVGNDEQMVNSGIYVPLLLGDQIKGVISAQSLHQFTYNKEHIELLKIIGSQVVNAIENSTLYKAVYERTIRDELTNLLNRRAFNKDIEEQLELAQKSNSSLVLIMFDSDNLKTVNDLYGHQVGDIYIKHIAKALNDHCNEGEWAYRLAGDEFMIIAPKITVDDALNKVNTIQRYLQDHPVELMGTYFPITVSVGIAAYPDHADNVDDLKRCADEALYWSKENKNAVNIYTNKRNPS